MRKGLLFLVFAGLVAVVSRIPTRADGPLRGVVMKGVGTSRIVVREGEVIVKFKDAVDAATVEKAIGAAGGVSALRSAYGPRYRVRLSPLVTIPEALVRFGSMAEVDYASPNQVRSALFTPNDQFYSFQWNLKLINAPRTWDIQQGDPSVAVAVIDTGVAFEDFGAFRAAPDWRAGTFIQGLNIFSNDSHANDDNGHGTNVASIIAEEANNGIGYASLAFSCSLMAIKALGADGSGDDFGIAEAIDYVTNFRANGANPARVINMSLGGPGDDTTLDAAIDRAVAAGITVVAAAGNDGTNVVSFPAAYKKVIAVGAVGNDKKITSYSNTGPEISVVAPGGSCDQSNPETGFVFSQNFDVFTPRFDTFEYDIGYCGTSQATPHVAAVAALLYRQGITDPASVRAAIEQNAEHLGSGAANTRNDQYGHGLVRPDLALPGFGLGQ